MHHCYLFKQVQKLGSNADAAYVDAMKRVIICQTRDVNPIQIMCKQRVRLGTVRETRL